MESLKLPLSEMMDENLQENIQSDIEVKVADPAKISYIESLKQ
jgi:hypothetical protein